MHALVFLLGAAVLIALGSAVLLLRHRQPKGDHHGIKQFQKEMRALSPEARKDVIDSAGVRIVPRDGPPNEEQ